MRLEKRFRFKGHDIAWDRLGDGPALVLLHGTPFSSHVWRRIAPELARDHTVYLYDLLGYGLSAKPDADVSLGVQNEVLAALFEHWGLVKPQVMAHDFGGATALRAHFLNRLDYERLLLIDPVAIRPWGSPFVQHVREHEAAFAGVPDYLQRAILRAYIRGAASRPMSDAELEPYLTPWLGESGQPGFYRQIAQMDLKYTDAVQDQYGELRCPVTLLWGCDDEWIPLVRGRELSAMLPDCDLTEIPGAGHLVQEDAPEVIISAALRFFR